MGCSPLILTVLSGEYSTKARIPILRAVCHYKGGCRVPRVPVVFASCCGFELHIQAAQREGALFQFGLPSQVSQGCGSGLGNPTPQKPNQIYLAMYPEPSPPPPPPTPKKKLKSKDQREPVTDHNEKPQTPTLKPSRKTPDTRLYATLFRASRFRVQGSGFRV